jgi:hypothetical protein
MRVGQCRRCEAQFEEAIDLEPDPWDPVASKIKSIDYEIWAADQTRRYIEYQIAVGIPEDFSFGDTLLWWLVTHGYSLQAHGNMLGYAFKNSGHLFTTESDWHFAELTQACWKLDVGLIDFIYRRYPEGWQGLQEERMNSRVLWIDHACMSKGAIRRAVGALTQILERRLHRKESLVEICEQRLGISTELAYTECPKIACKITERFLRTSRTKEEVRLAMAAWERRPRRDRYDRQI